MYTFALGLGFFMFYAIFLTYKDQKYMSWKRKYHCRDEPKLIQREKRIRKGRREEKETKIEKVQQRHQTL